jgi:hypothetical protein
MAKAEGGSRILRMVLWIRCEPRSGRQVDNLDARSLPQNRRPVLHRIPQGDKMSHRVWDNSPDDICIMVKDFLTPATDCVRVSCNVLWEKEKIVCLKGWAVYAACAAAVIHLWKTLWELLKEAVIPTFHRDKLSKTTLGIKLEF